MNDRIRRPHVTSRLFIGPSDVAVGPMAFFGGPMKLALGPKAVALEPSVASIGPTETFLRSIVTFLRSIATPVRSMAGLLATIERQIERSRHALDTVEWEIRPTRRSISWLDAPHSVDRELHRLDGEVDPHTCELMTRRSRQLRSRRRGC